MARALVVLLGAVLLSLAFTSHGAEILYASYGYETQAVAQWDGVQWIPISTS